VLAHGGQRRFRFGRCFAQCAEKPVFGGLRLLLQQLIEQHASLGA
jgi:hypothetical protein